MSEIKKMSLKEFCEIGLLQEVNRLFFHPRGLALCIAKDDVENTEVYAFDSIWDYREDPEGVIFGGLDPKVSNEKARRVEALLKPDREKLLGFLIQPLPTDETSS